MDISRTRFEQETREACSGPLSTMERLVNKGTWCGNEEANDVDLNLPIFLRQEWFALFDKYIFRSNGMPRNLCLRESGRTLAQLRLYQNSSRLIKGLHSLTNFYSPFFQLVGAEPIGAEEHSIFVREFHHFFADFDRIDLVPLKEHEVLWWSDAFAEIGFAGFSYSYSTNWYHDGIAGLDAFWADRPSRLRNTIRKKSEKLAKEGGFFLDILTPNCKRELWKYLGHYHQVYFSSWKQAEPYPAFIDAIVEHAWENGELRLGMAYHDGVPVAGQIWFVCGVTAYIFKLAHRPDYAQYSIGTILSKIMFDYVIKNDRVASIDFLTGDDRYKADWMTRHRKLYGLQLCNKRTVSGGACLIRNTFSSLNKRLKQFTRPGATSGDALRRTNFRTQGNDRGRRSSD